MKKQKAKKTADNVGEGSLYADNIAYLDKLVGQIVAELDTLKLRENTLIVFTGDNGSVPLIAHWPGVTPAGKVLPDLV